MLEIYFSSLQNPSSYKISSEMKLETVVIFGMLLYIGLILQCSAQLHRYLHLCTKKAKTAKDKLIFNAVRFMTKEVYKYVIQHNLYIYIYIYV